MRRTLAVLAVVALLVTTVGGVAMAQETSSNDSQYTIEELKEDGQHYSQPSMRIVPSENRLYWLEHRPVNQPWKDVTKASSGKMLDGQLQTDTLYLRTYTATSEPRSVDVTLVFWEQGTRSVSRGNATTTEAVAENVSVVHRTVTLEPGKSLGEIALPQHDESTRVTMWLDSAPETARWTFSHRSVAFTQPIDADTWSDFLILAAGFVILPALAFGWVGGRKVKTAIEKAGEPPGHGFGYYALVATIATALIMFGAYYYAAEVIVTLPVVLGLYVAVVYVGYMLATHSGRSETKLFWQPHIESVEAFTKTKLPAIGAGNSDKQLSFSEDMPFGKMQSFRVLDEGQDGLSIVRNGWFAFLARLKGGRARIENADELKTRFSLTESPWGEVFIVDPEATTLIEYEPPGLELKTPEVESWKDLVWPAALLGAGGVIAWQAAQQYGPTAWAVLLVAVPVLAWKFAVTGTDTHVHVEPAPAALRPVLASMLVLHLGYQDASKLREAEQFAWSALAGQEKEKMSWERDRDETFVERTFRDESTDADGSDGEKSESEAPREDDEDLIDRVGASSDD
ncbi:hypothetical protein GCM10009037_07180 [Halarchaeum grantii]|uniref:Uncharacterized protein n=1 Tax=Halarchaeum grantii TaxID=1193105 RepID=A0A830EUK3_9EURY|nr:hypothetical protein [Halarchaeum grantii]GGL26116.1 hypothetical protein GCM10009037_07180 [Halarchaeum grantii]